MRSSLLFLGLCAPVLARAHGLEAAGFLAGVAHPMGGADHLLAMVAVGIASTRGGRRLVWALPAIFMGGMALGFAMGLAGPHLRWVEAAVVLSVVLLGLLVAQPWRAVAGTAGLVVLVFGWCHGYSHGQEWPSQASPWAFALGFLGTTAGLHAIGVVTGLVYLEQPRPTRFFAATGALVAATGVALALAGAQPSPPWHPQRAIAPRRLPASADASTLPLARRSPVPNAASHSSVVTTAAKLL